MPRGRRAASGPIDDAAYPHATALTPEARESQVISAAFDLAEKQIREGTASAMVITHFLKLGSARDRMERELLAERTKLATAKAEAIEQGRKQEEMYAEAIKAMRQYSGYGEPEDYYDDEDY